jgi:hypothetical protein
LRDVFHFCLKRSNRFDVTRKNARHLVVWKTRYTAINQQAFSDHTIAKHQNNFLSPVTVHFVFSTTFAARFSLSTEQTLTLSLGDIGPGCVPRTFHQTTNLIVARSDLITAQAIEVKIILHVNSLSSLSEITMVGMPLLGFLILTLLDFSY